MKTAIASAALRQPAPPETTPPAADGGQLVFVRSAVVDNVGHVLGNVFQRLYHLANRTRESDAVVAAELESSTTRLEDFLRLLLDYVSPARLCLQSVSADEIVESLARQIADISGGAMVLAGMADVRARLLVDPGCLVRSFSLVAAQLRSPGRAPQPGITGEIATQNGSLSVIVRVAESRLQGRTSEAEMQWAVAERLIEIQGGSLREKLGSPGEVAWEVTLPLQA